MVPIFLKTTLTYQKVHGLATKRHLLDLSNLFSVYFSGHRLCHTCPEPGIKCDKERGWLRHVSFILMLLPKGMTLGLMTNFFEFPKKFAMESTTYTFILIKI